MSDIGQVRGPQPDRVQGNQPATGVFAGFKVAVGQAFSRVAEAFRSFGASMARFFSSLFSLSVRQAPSGEPRVGIGGDPAANRLVRELSMMRNDDSVAETVAVPGRTDITVTRIFTRDLKGEGRYTIDNERIIDDEENYSNENHGDKLAAVVGALERRFGKECIGVLSQYAHQGTFGALDAVLSSPDTPIETSDGRKVFPLSAQRAVGIDFSQDEDGSVRIHFAQELRNIQTLLVVSPQDTGPDVLPKEGATVRASFDIVLSRTSNGTYVAHQENLQIESDLGV